MIAFISATNEHRLVLNIKINVKLISNLLFKRICKVKSNFPILAGLIVQWHKDRRVVADVCPIIYISIQQGSVINIFAQKEKPHTKAPDPAAAPSV